MSSAQGTPSIGRGVRVCLVLSALASACATVGGPEVQVATSRADVSTTQGSALPTSPVSAVLGSSSQASTPKATTPTAAPAVLVGAGVLAADDFADFTGLRIGIVANQGSVVNDRHLIDLVHDSTNVELTAIFAPEHGVRGVADAGAIVDDTVDSKSGVTVFSLYGTTRQPTAAMLAEVDVVLYDLQDVGTRHYTYISTMGLVMQAAAASGIPVVVLDRPNPLGGLRIEGPVLEPSLMSFIGQYPIPSVYGLTAGELATAMIAEQWLPGLETLDLTVITMERWERPMLWPDTGLPWIAPSPGLPGFENALAYPGTVLVEATKLSYGSGTYDPFVQIGAVWLDAPAAVLDLNTHDLPGVSFEAVVFTPQSIPAMAPSPRLEGEELAGIRIHITHRDVYEPFRTGLVLLDVVERAAFDAGHGSVIDRTSVFDLLTGSTTLRRELGQGASVGDLLDQLDSDLATFDQLRQQYFLY